MSKQGGRAVQRLFVGCTLVFATLAVSVFSATVHSSEVKIQIAVYADGGAHRAALRNIVSAYERRHAHIDLELLAMRGIDDYNLKVENWMQSGVGPDIVYWYGGQRLNQFVETGAVRALDDIWYPAAMDKEFPLALRDTVFVEGGIYGIPITYYYWALYYHEPSLKKLGISVPQNWQQLLASCRQLRKQNVDLFAIGSQTAWSTHAWFDYLNLRIHGLGFYRQVLAGRVAYTDERIKTVLRVWKQMFDEGCFNKNHASYNLWQSFPRLLHAQSALSLIDGVPQGINSAMRADINIAPFPQINPDLPLYTVAPVNVFMVPSYVQMSDELKQVLRWIAGKDFQAVFNKPISRPAANRNAAASSDRLTRTMQMAIRNSPGGIQYLDRDTNFSFAKEVPAILVSFIVHLDVDQTAEQLEALRQQVFFNNK
ncbi:ABC transporter substrate-binding protein [Agaribacterium haliotis]|uniref:ABC transporter substrate-binding protein n=1 Tax=Agaribacterium haliotis TaxID=2013869 RepID=UPI001177E7A7|nr:ABC transporter substrate-binding protein [Agaribacterium haliotis]